MKDRIRSMFDEAGQAIRQACPHLTGKIARAVDLIVECYESAGGVLLFGNGGSAADAQHIACELVGRFMLDRAPLKAQALSTNTSSLTSVANDYDYETVFARQIEACGTHRDVAVGLSTSGDSPNVVAALAKARQLGMKTIALTGPTGGKCAKFADVLLDVPAATVPPRIQEVHAVVYHVICQLVEERIFGGK